MQPDDDLAVLDRGAGCPDLPIIAVPLPRMAIPEGIKTELLNRNSGKNGKSLRKC